MLRLASDRLFPVQPQPGEVAEDRRLEGRPAAPDVDVFDPQQKTAARFPRRFEIDQRRKRVSEMQQAVGAGREAEDRTIVEEFGHRVLVA